MPSVLHVARVALAVPFVAAARTLLVLWSARRWAHQVEFSALVQGSLPTARSRRAIPWAAAVSSAAARLRGSKCIVQVLALKWILRVIGIDAVIRVGVGRQSAGTFVSHAWLEVDGVRVLDSAPAQERITLRIDSQ